MLEDYFFRHFFQKYKHADVPQTTSDVLATFCFVFVQFYHGKVAVGSPMLACSPKFPNLQKYTFDLYSIREQRYKVVNNSAFVKCNYLYLQMVNTKETGDKGEELTVDFLKEKGYKILHTNWRFKKLEVDCIAKIGNTIVFIEVKTRSSNFDYPENAVNTAKQKLLIKAASAWCEIFLYEGRIRFDIISVQILNNTQRFLHFEDAFFPFDIP